MDIEIFPHRLLSADTTEKLLNELEDMEAVKRMVIHGPKLPPEELGHPDRRTIKIKDEEVDLLVKTGRILIEIEKEEATDTIDNIKEICKDHMPFGFDVHLGRFIKKEKTVTDHLKFREELEEMPEEMIGLTDPSARLKDRAKIIKRKKE